MDANREALEAVDTDVAEIICAEPMAGVAVADIADVVPGYVVAFDAPAELQSPVSANEEITLEIPDDLKSHVDEPVPPHKNGKLKVVLECMLFVSNEPMTAKQLAITLELDEEHVENELEALREDFDGSHGLQLAKIAGGYQLCTKPEYSEYCALILQPAKRKLSKAALETLAVVAYRQPCTMPEVEAVRGVSVDGVMKTLIERGLVREAGKKQTPGRPNLYATTSEFLEYFGLNDISELPDIDMLAVEEVKALEAQKELFTAEDAG